MLNKNLYLLISLIPVCGIIFAETEQEKPYSVFNDLGNQFSKAHQNVPLDDALELFDVGSRFKNDENKALRTEEKLERANKVIASQEEAYRIFARHEQRNNGISSDLNLKIDNQLVWRDLRVFQGNGNEKPYETLFSKINKTQTLAGSACLAKMVASPTSSKIILFRRQNAVKALVENHQLHDKVKNLLTKITHAEESCSQFWKPEITSFSDICGSTLQNDPDNKCELSPKTWASLSRKSSVPNLAAQTTKISLNIVSAMTKIGGPIKLIISGILVDDIHSEDAARKCVMIGYGAIGLIGATIWATKDIKAIHAHFKKVQSARHLLHDGLKVLSDCADDLLDLATESPELESQLQNLKFLEDFAHDELHDDISKLRELLDSNTISNPSSIFANHGTVGQTLLLARHIREKLTPVLLAIGELDAFSSIATLYNEHQDSSVKYCFPTYLENNKPVFALENGWDPFVDESYVVANSIKLGGGGKNHNAIISGPNAGGKSTFMRSVLGGTLFAQTIGIMPASSAELTPFSYIDSYVNIEDSPAAAKSLYRAEVCRVKELLENTQALKDGEFGIVIADEIFSGTNQDDASAIGGAVLQKVAKNTNSIWTVATHFPEVCKVAHTTGGIFANYFVEIKRYPDGTFHEYTFKIKQGSTTENTTLDILKEEGTRRGIIERATALLVKYKKA